MGLISNLIGISLDIIETPVSIIKDVATMGGVLTDEDEPYTKSKLKELAEDYERLKRKLKE